MPWHRLHLYQLYVQVHPPQEQLSQFQSGASFVLRLYLFALIFSRDLACVSPDFLNLPT